MNRDRRDSSWQLRGPVFKFLLGLATASLVLVCCEAGSYLLGNFPPYPDPLISEYRQDWVDRIYDHLLFWRFKPHAGRGNIHINSIGLRGPEIPNAKGKEFRVLSLGESTTFGWTHSGTLDYEDCYSARIERQVATVGAKPVRVINAGVPGYSIVQGYAYLRYHGLKLKPDAVLVYFGYNDFLPISFLRHRDAIVYRERAGIDDWSLLRNRERALKRLGAWLHLRSHLYRALTFAWHGVSRRHREESGSVTVEDSARPRVPNRRRREVLASIHRLCAEHEIRLTIIVPCYLKFNRHAPLLRKFARQNGVPIVDLPRRLRDRQVDLERFFEDPFHLNAAGHRLVGEEIVAVAAPLWSTKLVGERLGSAVGSEG